MIGKEILRRALVCPGCRCCLEEERAEEMLRCRRCGSDFPVIDGVPWMRTGSASEDELRYLLGARGWLRGRPRLYRWAFRLLAPVLVTGPDAARRLAPIAEAGELVLDLGSGNDRRHPLFCNLDLLPYPQVDAVVEAESLPIAAAAAAGILSIAVLEHLGDPRRTLAEARRVLRPGGLLFIAVPFLQPFHAAPHDYRRWTLAGLREEIGEGFAVEEEGVYCGPASALAWILAEWFALLLCCGSTRLRGKLALLLQALCSPIKWIDVLLARLPGAAGLASVVYLQARRLEETGGGEACRGDTR